MTKTVTSSGTTAADSIRNVPLDLVADEVQHVLDARTRQGQRGDGDDRDQRDDQGVLDQRLTLLGPHLRQVEPHRERLKHVALLSPLEGGHSVVLLLFTRVRAFPDTREWVVSPIPSAQLPCRWGADAFTACKRDTRRTSARRCGAGGRRRCKGVAT